MTEKFDVVVIGCGIHGAGVAQAAAARGHSVLVLEQRAIAHGSSSRSSKLIHGGLRYLESAQLALVHECLHERDLLLRLAPELVRMVPFHIPVYRDTTRRPWKLRAGLTLYALLSGLRSSGRFSSLPRAQWPQLDGLAGDGLEAVFRYQDAQTDDALLTRAVMESALRFGAELRMPARFVSGELGKSESLLDYELDGRMASCRATVVVNASGPWVNHCLDRFTPGLPQRAVDLVQGAHILLPGRLEQGIYYMEAPQDRRAVFAMPWQDHIMVGTTEQLFHGDPERVHPLDLEKRYLFDVFTRYFPDRSEGGMDAINGAFAGLRVLPASDGDAFSRPRGTLLLTDRSYKPRVLSIYGGKLTAYRAEADKVMARLAPSLPQRMRLADTRDLSLPPPQKL
jgi:glycerol-3-phosphate dehydrogenase